MQHVSCSNTHHDITDLVNHGLDKNTITWNISGTEHNFSKKQPVTQMTHFEKLSFFSGGNPIFLTQINSCRQKHADEKVL